MEKAPENDLAAADDGAGERTLDQLIEDFRAGKGPHGAAALVERLDAAESELEKATDTIAELIGKLAMAEKKAKAGKISTGKAGPAVATRKIGPFAERMDAPDLRTAIGAAEKIEILCGDGKRDVGCPAFMVDGEVWADHALGLALTLPLEIQNFSAPGSQPYHIAGFALMLDGKQAAWSPRAVPLHVAAGQKYRIENDIFF